jgi:hypothetical protein
VEGFEVNDLEKAAKLLLVGVAAGVAFYVINKYLLTPAENALGLPAAA